MNLSKYLCIYNNLNNLLYLYYNNNKIIKYIIYQIYFYFKCELMFLYIIDMEQPHYYPSKQSLHQDLVQVFVDHLYSHLSWSQWVYTHSHQLLPEYHNEINQIRNILLPAQCSLPVQSTPGAYLPLDAFFEDILLTYIICEAFGNSPMRD